LIWYFKDAAKQIRNKGQISGFANNILPIIFDKVLNFNILSKFFADILWKNPS